MITQFVSDDGLLSQAALLEQCTFLTCVGCAKDIVAQGVLNFLGGGKILNFDYDNKTLNPNFMLIQQGDIFNICLYGVQANEQAMSVLGGWIRNQYKATNAIVNGFFREQWDVVFKKIQNKILPCPKTTKFYISGYSYGGGVATVAAIDLVAGLGKDRVQLMTFGTPKSFRLDPAIVLPTKIVPIANDNDIVPYLPPDNAGAILEIINGDIPSQLTGHWRHIAPTGSQNSTGDIVQYPASAWDNLSNYSPLFDDIYPHYIQEYLRRILVKCRTLTLPDQDQNIMPIADILVNTPSGPAVTKNVDTSAYITPATLNTQQWSPAQGNPVNNVNINTIIGLSGDIILVQRGPSANIGDFGGTNMAYSGLWKITLLINNGSEGRSESHVYRGSSNTADAIQKAKNLGQQRVTVLGNSTANANPDSKTLGAPALEFIRIADALNPRQSFIIDMDGNRALFGPHGATAAGADTYFNAMSFRMLGTNVNAPNNQAYGNLQIIGQPDTCIKDGSYDPQAKLANNAFWDTNMKNYLNYLTNANNNLGFVGLSSGQPKKVVTAFQLNGGNKWQLTYGVAHGYQSGMKVRLTACDVKGFNGTYKIQVVDNLNITLVEGPPTDLQVPQIGKTQAIQDAAGARLLDFYQYTIPPQGNVVSDLVSVRKKNPGRQFVAVTFKKRVRKLH